MKEKNIELLAHYESHWIGCGNNKISHSGSPSNHVCNVAIALSPRACSSWDAAGIIFHPISERIIICLKTHLSLSYASVFAIHAPTNPVSTNVEASVQSDNFYDLLQDTLSSVPPRDMVIILGDFNAHVGSNFVLHSSVIGRHGLGEYNKNGTTLLDFCVSNQLLITNT